LVRGSSRFTDPSAASRPFFELASGSERPLSEPEGIILLASRKEAGAVVEKKRRRKPD